MLDLSISLYILRTFGSKNCYGRPVSICHCLKLKSKSYNDFQIFQVKNPWESSLQEFVYILAT